MPTPTPDHAQRPADQDSPDVADSKVSTDTNAHPKPNGLGEDGTIPNNPNGVAAGHTATASNFNPEEDEDAS